jgi:predicted nuclease of predicted toxin-antitoxin system
MHKLLFDQNLSYRIIKQIKHLFPDSNHVRLLNLDKTDDIGIWQYAKDHNFHIVSKDTDFIDINILEGFPPKVIWINTGNVSTDAIIALIKKKSKIILAFLDVDEIGLLELG